MVNNPLDDIVKCTVEIANPGTNDAAFDTILVVTTPPEGEGTLEAEGVFAVGSADELLDYGYGMESDAYLAATIAFSQNPSPDELMFATLDEDDTVGEVLTRAEKEASFYGIILNTVGKSGSEGTQEGMRWAESHEKLLGLTCMADIPLEGNTNYYRSFCVCAYPADAYDGSQRPVEPRENKFLALAAMAKCFGYDPGTETWNLKELAALQPTALSTQQKKDMEEKNINTFLRYAGCNMLMGGKTLAGEWIDVIRFRDWLKAEMQFNVFSALKLNRKVPYTDAGIGLIEAQMIETLAKGQSIGGIAPTEYDADENEIPGYTVTVPLASDLTEEERHSRKLTGCRYTARLAGAIHAVEIEGTLTF